MKFQDMQQIVVDFLLGNATMTKLDFVGYVLSVGDGIARVYGLHDGIFFVELIVIPLVSCLVVVIGLFRSHNVYTYISLKIPKQPDLFKDGRNLPLSLTVAAVFLGWSLQQGFLSQMSLGFKGIWSLVY